MADLGKIGPLKGRECFESGIKFSPRNKIPKEERNDSINFSNLSIILTKLLHTLFIIRDIHFNCNRSISLKRVFRCPLFKFVKVIFYLMVVNVFCIFEN